jgi:hypothetical protein
MPPHLDRARSEMRPAVLLLAVALLAAATSPAPTLALVRANTTTTGTTGTPATTTTASTTTGGSPPPPPPSPPKKDTGCATKTSCKDCTSGHYGCVWCAKAAACIDGSWYGPNSKNKTSDRECGDWKWEQCTDVDGVAALGIVAGAIALVLIVVCCLIFCCCRKKQGRRGDEPVLVNSHHQDDERTSLLAEKNTPQTDQRRAELARKYPEYAERWRHTGD